MARATRVSSRFRCRVLPALILGLALLARPAWAQPSVDPPPTSAAPTEVGRAVGQLFAGGAVAFLSMYAIVLAGPANVAVAAVAPVAVGSMVCWIGSNSTYYDGGCLAPILGAYVGAFTVIPAALLGASLVDPDRQDQAGFWAGLAGAVLAWVIVQPLASTISWRIWKKPRAASAPRVTLVPPLSSPRRSSLIAPEQARRQRAPGERTVPLFALSF